MEADYELVSESRTKEFLTDMTPLISGLPLQEKADEDDKVIDTDLIEPGTQSQWHEAYYTLTLLVKIMKRCPKEVNFVLRTRMHALLEWYFNFKYSIPWCVASICSYMVGIGILISSSLKGLSQTRRKEELSEQRADSFSNPVRHSWASCVMYMCRQHWSYLTNTACATADHISYVVHQAEVS